jgi:hypothetical protein
MPDKKKSAKVPSKAAAKKSLKGGKKLADTKLMAAFIKF